MAKELMNEAERFLLNNWEESRMLEKIDGGRAYKVQGSFRADH